MKPHPLGAPPSPRFPSLADVPLPAILLRWPYSVDEDSPWRLLAGCVLRDGCRRDVINHVWPLFFRRWPGPHECLSASEDEVEAQLALLTSFGLPRQKVECIRRLAQVWREVSGEDPHPPLSKVRSLPGCRHAYAHDAYLVFAQHCTDLNEPIEELALRDWVEHRVRYGWTYEDETGLIVDALGLLNIDVPVERLRSEFVRCS